MRMLKYSFGGLAMFGGTYIYLHPKEKKYVQTMAGSTIRFLRSFRIGLVISMDYWIAPMIGYTSSEIHQRSANRIIKGCLQNGGIFIKLGQGLAAINHILPQEYIDSLTILQDKCLTRGMNEVEELFMQEFGKKPEEVFRKIDPEPVAAASLAQVYKGETMDGNPVAIKVQYIDLRDRYKTDMKMLNYLLKIVTAIHPKFDLHWVVDELYETLAQELDFEIEGKNAERCAKNFKKYGFVHVPEIYWDLSTKTILTTEWIDGVKINNIDAIKKQGLDIRDIDTKLITIMADQIFHTGFVHADPHPGNILVRKGTDKKSQIVILDHGLYEFLPENIRINLCKFWEALVLKDNQSLEKYGKELQVEDSILLAEMLTQSPYSVGSIVKADKGKFTSEEYMTQQAQKQFDKISTALKNMPKTMLLIIRNLNTIRAITKDHGNVVNRYKLMAKVAVRGKYKVAKMTINKYIMEYASRVQFETQLWLRSFIQFLLIKYLNILNFIGYDTKKAMELLDV